MAVIRFVVQKPDLRPAAVADPHVQIAILVPVR